MDAEHTNFDPLHGQSPDYTRCSLDDLYDVRRRISAEAYPDRAEAVDREIARRLSLPETKRASRKPLPIRVMRRAVGAAEILGGLLGTVSVLSVLWSVFVHGRPHHLRTLGVFAGLASVLIVYILTVVAGRELFRQRRAGVILSIAVLALQVASVRIFGFAYELALPGSVYLYFPSGQLTFRLSGHWGLGWAQASQPAFLGINLVVLLMLGLVLGTAQPPSQGSIGISERPV